MATIKGFIFDLDGVLVNTTSYHLRAWQKVAERLDFVLKEKDYEHMKGLARMEAMEKLLEIGGKEISKEDFDQLLAEKNRWYLENIQELNAEDVGEGVLEFLDNCSRLNLKVSVGTSSKNSEAVLEKVGLSDYFEVVINGSDISKSKPHPEVFLKAAEQMQLDPQDIIVFEDSRAGIEAANNGGFRSVGIGKKKLLSEADLVLKDLQINPAEVINHLNF